MEKFQEPAVCVALQEYKKIVSKHNLYAAKCFVNHAEACTPGSDDERSDGENFTPGDLEAVRLKWCMRTLTCDEQAPAGISKPQDIIANWHSFASKQGLDGARVSGSAEERAKRWDSIVRGLRDGFQEIGDDAAELDIPGDFAILLKHADTLEGHQWHKRKNKQQCVEWFQGFKGYDDAKASVRDPENLRLEAYAWGRDKPDLDIFEHVVAGFETGYVTEGGCFMIFGQLIGEEESKWYYYLNLGQFGIKVWDSLVDFLKWYQHDNIASEREIKEDCEEVWGESWAPSA